MIEFINSVLQFDFVIDTYIPMIVKLLIPIAISFAIAAVFAAIGYVINGIPSKIINIIAYSTATIFSLLAIVLIIVITIMPVLLSTIALKMYMMKIFNFGSEIVYGIISAFICSTIFVLTEDYLLKNTNS